MRVDLPIQFIRLMTNLSKQRAVPCLHQPIVIWFICIAQRLLHIAVNLFKNGTIVIYCLLFKIYWFYLNFNLQEKRITYILKVTCYCKNIKRFGQNCAWMN